MHWLSEQLGKNPTYVQQYIERRSPKELKFEDKLTVAELLDMELSQLGVSDFQVRKRAPLAPGLDEDAEPYEPPRTSLLVRHPAIGYVRMKSNVLENHPLGISEGTILAFDMSQEAIDGVQSEQIVVVQLYDKDDPMKARTVIREYIRPGLLITNRAEDNEIISMSDDTQPFEPRIKGVFRKIE